jgi:hypothetical protein
VVSSASEVGYISKQTSLETTYAFNQLFAASLPGGGQEIFLSRIQTGDGLQLYH